MKFFCSRLLVLVSFQNYSILIIMKRNLFWWNIFIRKAFHFQNFEFTFVLIEENFECIFLNSDFVKTHHPRESSSSWVLKMMMKNTFPMISSRKWMSCATEMEKSMNGKKLPGDDTLSFFNCLYLVSFCNENIKLKLRHPVF